MHTLKFKILALFLSVFLYGPYTYAQLTTANDEWFGAIDRQTAERGITVTTPSGDATLSIRPGVFSGETRALLRKSTERSSASSFLPPRDGMRYASDLFYFSIYDLLSLKGDLVLVFKSEPITRRGGVYLYDMRSNRWFPLASVRAERGTFRAFTDSLSGYVAVLEYENSDAELLSLINDARAVVVANGNNQLVVAHHSREQYSLASLTKLMTALVFLEHNPGWSTRVAVNGEDDAPPSKIAFQHGDVVDVRTLFDSMLVGSKNNSARALRRATGVSESTFVSMMNEKALTLGMESTHFVDVTGLSPDNRGTARDMALLARAALTHRDIRSAAGRGVAYVQLLNRNQVFRVPTTNELITKGIKTLGKTGYLPEVGYNLVLLKSQNDQPIVFVVLGAASNEERFELGRRLLERPW